MSKLKSLITFFFLIVHLAKKTKKKTDITSTKSAEGSNQKKAGLDKSKTPLTKNAKGFSNAAEDNKLKYPNSDKTNLTSSRDSKEKSLTGKKGGT